MQQRTILLFLGLSTLCLGCKRPDFIRLQPTIEEAPGLAKFVRISDPSVSSQLLRGFYPLEAGSWRWTGPKFNVALGIPPSAPRDGAQLLLAFTLPEATIRTLKRITLTAAVGSTALNAESFDSPGEHLYRRDLPASVFKKDTVEVEFSVDKFLKLPEDGRELGVIVTSVGMEPK